MKESELNSFLIEANAAGYASGDEKKEIKEKDGSTTIIHSSGDWSMHDNYFGGEPYGGREVIFFKNKPVWIMVYYGAITGDIEHGEVYKFLQESLKEMPENAPFRGPKNHENDSWQYLNEWEGNLNNFKGRERILKNKEEIYFAEYAGGLVDKN